MNLIKTVVSSVAVLVLSQNTFAHSSHGHELTLQKTETLSLSSKHISNFKIEAGSGKMKIASADVDAIEVQAEIYQKESHNNYCLTLKKHGGSAKLESATCHHNNETRIDLTIKVPKKMNLDIDDGSGPIEVLGVANLTIEDGSGSIKVSQISGKVEIQDGSGRIDIKDVKNDVSIDDGSGAIDVRDISGKVTISDGSGSINVDTADSFELVNDGSGSVHVDNIAGKVEMDN